MQRSGPILLWLPTQCVLADTPTFALKRSSCFKGTFRARVSCLVCRGVEGVSPCVVPCSNGPEAQFSYRGQPILGENVEVLWPNNHLERTPQRFGQRDEPGNCKKNTQPLTVASCEGGRIRSLVLPETFTALV